ncbi:MAG: DUF5348 domain-containing protein [Spirochaetes bacterium]|nr:DUF5348 domain-containing protein [Spirochaetota bacterium]
MLKEGYLFLNDGKRFAIDGYYWTCGDSIEIYDDGEWLKGRIEANNDGQYYATDGLWVIYLKEGLKVRAVD